MIAYIIISAVIFVAFTVLHITAPKSFKYLDVAEGGLVFLVLLSVVMSFLYMFEIFG